MNSAKTLLTASTALAAIGTSVYFMTATDDLKQASLTPPLLGLLDKSLNQDELEQFNGWVAKKARSYESHEEYLLRFKAFKRNLQRLRAYNKEAVEAMKKQDSQFEPSKIGLNNFADWTEEEYKNFLGEKMTTQDSSSSEINGVEDIPQSIDWRTKGVVGPVRNQGQTCGAGWAFIATSTIQSANQIAGGMMSTLSAEQFNDCTEAEGNKPCGAGTVENCFAYAKKHPIQSESQYPWVGKVQRCHAGLSGLQISDYKAVPEDSMELSKALVLGPVAVAVDASSMVFQSYTGGIISSECGTSVDHFVLLVGYSPDYWLIQNTWGASWGENGYVRIKRDLTTKGPGVCGILSQAAYPII